MIPLKPQPPFVWPEPRAIEKMCTYEYQPPFGELALSSHSLFGIVSALTERGVNVLEYWLKGNPDLKVCLVVMVYPLARRGRRISSVFFKLWNSKGTSCPFISAPLKGSPIEQRTRSAS